MQQEPLINKKGQKGHIFDMDVNNEENKDNLREKY
jgi:hypothetical protein